MLFRSHIQYLLASDDHAVPQPEAHRGQLGLGLVRDAAGAWCRQGEGQGGTGPGQRFSQQGAELLGEGGGVGHLQGHIEGLGDGVGRALPPLVLGREQGKNGSEVEINCQLSPLALYNMPCKKIN